MKVVVLRCVKCDTPKIVMNGEIIPSFCFYCGGYLVYVEETEISEVPKPERGFMWGGHEWPME